MSKKRMSDFVIEDDEVEDSDYRGSDEESSDDDKKPAVKKVKKEPTVKKKEASSSTKSEKSAASSSSAPPSSDPGRSVDSEGAVTFELTAKRKVTVRKYRGKTYIDIREFYLNDAGQIAPGRKGISLDVQQFERLKSLIPEIDKELRSH